MGDRDAVHGQAPTMLLCDRSGTERFQQGDVGLVEDLRRLVPGPADARFVLPLRRGYLAHGWRTHDGLVLVAAPWDRDTTSMDETMERLEALKSSRSSTSADDWLPPPDGEGTPRSAPPAAFAVTGRRRRS